MQKLKETAKMIAALVGALITAGTTLIPADWNGWLGLVFAVLTAIATYTIPNATPATPNVDPSELTD